MCENDSYTDGVFYHYTSTANAKNIQKTGVIYKGKHGTILNKMDPHQFFRNEILQNNYGRKMDDYQNKADYVVLVTEGQLNYRYLEEMKQNNRHFFLYYKNIQVSATQIFDKPKCSSRNVQQACSSNDDQNPYANNGQTSSPNNDQSIGSSNNSAPLIDWTWKAGLKKILNLPGAFLPNPDRSLSQNVPHKQGNSPQSNIRVNLRKDQNIEDTTNRSYQLENVTIFAPKWVEHGLNILKNSINFPISFKITDGHHKEKSFQIDDISLKTLQQISRNEKWNTNGLINFQLFGDLEPSVIYSLKDLVRQTVIVGSDRTTHFGGFRNSPRIPQNAEVYVCDLIALQFQQNYNSGRLVIIGSDLPKGKLDDFIYESVTGESKPSYEDAKKDRSGRFVENRGFFFDSKAYVKFVARDVLLSGLALNHSAKEKINFKFVKYGCGFYAGQFSAIINSFVTQGVAEGLKELLPKIKNISSVELVFFQQNDEIIKICRDNRVEVRFSDDDPLKATHPNNATATTNCADNHACIGNPMGFNSVDGAIAENLSLKGFNMCPNINQNMKEVFLDF